MDYNTETLTELARQVAEVFKTNVAQHIQTGETSLTIADVEKGFRELLRQIGAQALSVFLSSGLWTPAAEMPCACGGTLQYQRRRSATLTTVFGKLTYERAYYAGCPCGHGLAPLDETYGLEPGAMSSGLAALLGLAGIEFGFDESRAWLQAFLLFDVSENTVRSETQTLGELQAERETDWVEQSQDEDSVDPRFRVWAVPELRFRERSHTAVPRRAG